MRSEQYRRHAAECLCFAQEMTSPSTRAVLLDMAQNWLALADQAEKNAKMDLAREAPLRVTG